MSQVTNLGQAKNMTGFYSFVLNWDLTVANAVLSSTWSSKLMVHLNTVLSTQSREILVKSAQMSTAIVHLRYKQLLPSTVELMADVIQSKVEQSQLLILLVLQ